MGDEIQDAINALRAAGFDAEARAVEELRNRQKTTMDAYHLGQRESYKNGRDDEAKLRANFPEKCPITRRPFFMVISHPELGRVPTYGGLFDSYTIPHMEGSPNDPYHERELTCHHYDHDLDGWVEDLTIPMRVINEDVLNALLDAAALRARVAELEKDAETAAATERERICAAIKAEDDHCADGDYMMDSDDCIKVARGQWVRPDWDVQRAAKGTS